MPHVLYDMLRVLQVLFPLVLGCSLLYSGSKQQSIVLALVQMVLGAAFVFLAGLIALN